MPVQPAARRAQVIPARAGAEAGLPRLCMPTCLLLALSRGPSHGYDLLEEVRSLGVVSADAAGVYRALRSFERQGFAESWWEPSRSGPARRTYRLLRAGREALGESIDDCRDWHRQLGAILEAFDDAGEEQPPC